EFVSRLFLAPVPRLWWNHPCVSRDAHAPDLFGIGAINNSMDGVGRPYDAHRANLLEWHHQPTNIHRKEDSIYMTSTQSIRAFERLYRRLPELGFDESSAFLTQLARDPGFIVTQILP